MTFGDRVEEFTILGSHTTTLTVGDFLYETLLGEWKTKAGQNTLSVDSVSGHDMTLAVGDSSTLVSTGSHSVVSQQNASLRAVTGSVVVAGTLGVRLVAPGVPNGGIMAGSDLDPMSGIPYAALGLVPRLQTLSPT
jgi:hypothetical protein